MSDFDGSCRDCGDDLSAAYDDARLCYSCLLGRYRSILATGPATARIAEILRENRHAPDFSRRIIVTAWMTGTEAAAFLKEQGAEKSE